MKTFKVRIAETLSDALSRPVAWSEVVYPPKASMGDLSFPCFPLAKERKKPPAAIAGEIAGSLTPPPFVSEVKAQGPYLNFHIDPGELARTVLGDIEARGEGFGHGDAGAGKTVVIDYSSPNISKALAFHHIRSTMIGQVLANLHRAAGWTVEGVNHLGDWGTTFGKLMVAVTTQGAKVRLDTARLADLNDLYVAFHRDAEANPALEDEARSWFKRLEDGDPEARAAWERFREISLADFNRVYEKLGVTFDHVIGESFYIDRLDETIRLAREAGITKTSEGALVVDLGEDMPPALLRKSDGATLYVTRDLAAALYRQERFGFDRALYVTDAGQGLHFRQLFSVLARMGYEWAATMTHVPFGVLLMGGQRGKTREGNVILLEDVLDEAHRRTLALMEQKNPDLPDKETVARQVGVGAVIFNDLKNKRVKDVNFSWDEVLNFDGDAGPYVQYAHVRVHGILRKYGRELDGQAPLERLVEPEEKALLLLLGRLGEVVEKAVEVLEPSLVAQYLLDVSAAFHRFHHRLRVIGNDPGITAARVRLVHGAGVVLKNGLALLNMDAPEKM